MLLQDIAPGARDMEYIRAARPSFSPSLSSITRQLPSGDRFGDCFSTSSAAVWKVLGSQDHLMAILAVVSRSVLLPSRWRIFATRGAYAGHQKRGGCCSGFGEQCHAWAGWPGNTEGEGGPRSTKSSAWGGPLILSWPSMTLSPFHGL